MVFLPFDLMKNRILHSKSKKGYINPLRADVLESLVWPGGGAQHHPWKIPEGVV